MFSNFKSVTKAEWLAKVKKDLKGKPIERLNWELEGMVLSPFYHQEDIALTSPIIQHREDNHWEIGERIVVEDIHVANRQALDALRKGANALYFVLPTMPTQDALMALLNGIQHEWISTHFKVNTSDWLGFLAYFMAVLKAKNQTPQQIRGSFQFEEAALFADAKQLKTYLELLPNVQFFPVNVIGQKETIVENLALALQKANAYLTQINALGLDLKTLHNRIQFLITINDAYFPSIAKIRALKLLWQQVLSAWDDNLLAQSLIDVHLTAHTQTEDEHYNKIKATTQAMSAVIGGANRLYIYPSDAFKQPNGTTFSRRIALNVQHLMQQQSYLDRVIDPGAGSYFIETLTDELAVKAWALFQASFKPDNHQN